MEEYEDEVVASSDKLSGESEQILQDLENDEEFNAKIEVLIQGLNDGTLDLSMLQSKFILLIKATLQKNTKHRLEQIEHQIKKAEKNIHDQLALLSRHMLMQRASQAKEGFEDLANPKDKYESMSARAIKNTKQILKRFAIYEIYKVMSPRTIAGETQRQNFISDYITGGIKKAMRYDRSYLAKAERDSPSLLKQLDKSHSRFVRGGGMKSLGRV